jgi:hypothetical protein
MAPSAWIASAGALIDMAPADAHALRVVFAHRRESAAGGVATPAVVLTLAILLAPTVWLALAL